MQVRRIEISPSPLQLLRQRQDVGQLQRAIDLAVGGEDLFQQRRTGARQAHDEDRVRRGAAVAGILLEQIRGARFDLRLQFRRHLVRAVAQLLALQPVAFVIEAEGIGIFPPVLMGLAEREIEVDAVHQTQIVTGKLGMHRRDLAVLEPERLEIGERIIRIAEIRARSDRGAIGGDGLPLLPTGLERMAARGQRGRVLGQALQDSLEQPERLVIFAGLHALDRQMRLKQRIVRLQVEQMLRLFLGRGEFLPPAQHLHIVEPELDIVRLETDRAFQQKFGIVEDAEPDADIGQQAHAFDIVRVFPQEMAA